MLLCIDFDETMVQASLHRTLSDAFVLSPKHLKQFLTNKTENEQNKELLKASNFRPHVDRFLEDETKGWKNKEQLVDLLKTGSKLKCHIAIVSFGSYPDAIKYALTKLDLEQAILEEIYVKSYLSDKNERDSTGKQNHIKKAMEHFNVCDNKKVVLIDDDLNNVKIASKNGIHAIPVGKDDTNYLDQVFNILNEEEQR